MPSAVLAGAGSDGTDGVCVCVCTVQLGQSGESQRCRLWPVCPGSSQAFTVKLILQS